MDNKNYIIVAGFFGSGSSAVVDLLREFAGFYECRAEIRIIKDPYGIKQMEQVLTNDWDVITSSAAITDFLDLCKRCGRSGGGKNIFARAGLNYSKTINKDFMGITNKYIDTLTSYKYRGDYYHYKFRKSYFRYVTDRMRWAIEHISKGKLKTANRKTELCYYAKPSSELFMSATQNYFDELFNPFFASGEYNHIILDQAISPNDAVLVERYFGSAKMIIIDRDPRDMFADDLENVMSISPEKASIEYAKLFVDKQKAMRERIPQNHPNVLNIRFEDLVLKQYEAEKRKIMDFLSISEEQHIYKKKYLNPEVSKKNVGIWKKHYQECSIVMDYIHEKLQDLCYEE